MEFIEQNEFRIELIVKQTGQLENGKTVPIQWERAQWIISVCGRVFVTKEMNNIGISVENSLKTYIYTNNNTQNKT